jgi:hypothetical protein
MFHLLFLPPKMPEITRVVMLVLPIFFVVVDLLVSRPFWFVVERVVLPILFVVVTVLVILPPLFDVVIRVLPIFRVLLMVVFERVAILNSYAK